MSGRQAGGESGLPGRRPAASHSHIAAMQLFHELKQQFPALPDHAVSACIAQHCHDPAGCHHHLSQAVAPRSTPYPTCLRNMDSDHIDTNLQTNNSNLKAGEQHSTNSNFPANSNFYAGQQPQHCTPSNFPANSNLKMGQQQHCTSNKQLDTNEFTKSFETSRFSDITSKARSAFFGLESDKKTNETSLKTRSVFESNLKSSSPKMNTRNEIKPNEILRTFENEKSPRFGKKFSEIPSPSDELKKLRIDPKKYLDKTTIDPPIEVSPGAIRKSVVSDRTSPPSPSEAKDFSPLSKPPISPLTSKRPPKATYDARISKLPDEGLTNTGAVKKTPARPASLDLPNKTSDSVEPVVNLSVNVNVDVEQGKGQGPRRHSAVLEVTPEPTWLHQTPPSPRSFTSVNLTLRTPTTPPQGPINICSSPTSFTYTTNSWDRRQGLQSRLQITVGPTAGVGTVTAMRSRPRSFYQEEEIAREKTRAESMPDLCQVQESTNRVVLISRQKERKEQLRNELKVGKERLYAIQKEIQGLRLENTPDFRTRLKKEIKHLQAQCERLTREVDRHSESRVPLGETNEEFYRHIYTGQRPPSQRRRAHAYNAAAEDNEPRWPCHICTFRNHPSMDKCEVCEMPRVLLVSAGPGENIHIRFSPGTTTRVIHSWVV